MTNTSYRYLFLLLLPLFLLVANSCERSTTEKRILIVQSYEPDFQAYKDIEEAFKKGSITFTQNRRGRLEGLREQRDEM